VYGKSSDFNMIVKLGVFVINKKLQSQLIELHFGESFAYETYFTLDVA